MCHLSCHYEYCTWVQTEVRAHMNMESSWARAASSSMFFRSFQPYCNWDHDPKGQTYHQWVLWMAWNHQYEANPPKISPFCVPKMPRWTEGVKQIIDIAWKEEVPSGALPSERKKVRLLVTICHHEKLASFEPGFQQEWQMSAADFL